MLAYFPKICTKNETFMCLLASLFFSYRDFSLNHNFFYFFYFSVSSALLLNTLGCYFKEYTSLLAKMEFNIWNQHVRIYLLCCDFRIRYQNLSLLKDVLIVQNCVQNYIWTVFWYQIKMQFLQVKSREISFCIYNILVCLLNHNIYISSTLRLSFLIPIY